VQPTLLALSPETGRWHQLRLHAAQGGAALLGDRRHGGATRVCTSDGQVLSVGRVALDAVCVDMVDEEGKRWWVQSAVASDLRKLWVSVGGQARQVDEGQKRV
jgi:23S rRNA-/tRNA-specific pseudouridylate synthase